MLYLIEHITHYADCYLVQAEDEEEAEGLIQDGSIQPCAVKAYPDENSMIFAEAYEGAVQALALFSKKESNETNTTAEARSEDSEEIQVLSTQEISKENQ